MKFDRDSESGLFVPSRRVVHPRACNPRIERPRFGASAQAMIAQKITAGGGFIPSDIPDMELWLKAMALSLSDGDPVSTWTDSSGHSRNATQSSSLRPTFKTNIVNGKPVVRFDGLQNFMVTAANNYAVRTMGVIYKRTGTNTGGGGSGDYASAISARSASADKTGASDVGFSLDFAADSVTGGVNDKVTTVNTTCNYVEVDGVSGNAAQFGTYYQGVPATINQWHFVFFKLDAATSAGNKEFAIGADNFTANGRLLEADLAEIMIWSSEPTAGELTNLKAYALSQYGI